MDKKRTINAIIWTMVQFAMWAAVVCLWMSSEDASAKCLVLGMIFPGLIPAFIGLYRDLSIIEREGKKYHCNSWED